MGGREIQAHMPEDFWHIQVTHTDQHHKKTEFSWDRGRLFDHTAATVLYEMCVEEPLASVTKASSTRPAEHLCQSTSLSLSFLCTCIRRLCSRWLNITSCVAVCC